MCAQVHTTRYQRNIQLSQPLRLHSVRRSDSHAAWTGEAGKTGGTDVTGVTGATGAIGGTPQSSSLPRRAWEACKACRFERWSSPLHKYTHFTTHSLQRTHLLHNKCKVQLKGQCNYVCTLHKYHLERNPDVNDTTGNIAQITKTRRCDGTCAVSSKPPNLGTLRWQGGL